MEMSASCQHQHQYSANNLESLERAEEELITSQDDKTCSPCGDQQAECLTALDFIEILTDDLRFFNACRAELGTQGTC
eukprot:10174041-Prorocentrum_lima.AAC.1